MPRDDVERRVIDRRLPQAAEEFRDDVELAVAIFVGCDRRFEITGIRQPVGSDWSELRQAEGKAVIFADVPARLVLRQLDAELDAARNHADLAGRHLEDAELGVQAESSQLRHDQHFSVGVREEPFAHGCIGGIEVDGDACLHGGVAVAAERDHAIKEIRRLFRQRQRIPAQLIRRGPRFSERAAAYQAQGKFFIRTVRDRGANAIGPGAAIE